MNIAFLLPSLGGGGAERVAQQVGRYYVERGNKVYYFLGAFNIRDDYDVQGEIVHTGIGPVDVSRSYGMLYCLLNLVRNIYRLRALKKKYQIDVSISFMEDFNYLNVFSRDKDKVIVRVCTILSECEELSGKLLYRKDFIHHVYSRADKVVVMSSFGYREMKEIYGIPKEKIAVIPNSIASIFRNETDSTAWHYGDFTVVTMGRLSPEKQQDRLIRAFRVVAERKPEARLIIFGKGPLAHYLQGLCKIYRIEDKVVFAGFTKHPARFLRNAKVFVMTSKIEGFSCATIEAMSCGVPVVATDSPGGLQDIVGGGKKGYGILTLPMPRKKVKPKDALTEEELLLGKAILSILEDERLYEDYRRRSFQRSKDYEINKIIKLWNQVIGLET